MATPEQLFADHVSRFETEIGKAFTDRPAFRARVAEGLAFKASTHAEQKLSLLENGFFSEELLEALICGREGYAPLATHKIWKRLEQDGIVINAFGTMANTFVNYHLDSKKLLQHLNFRTLHNIFYPPFQLARRYENAIVAVDVEKDGAQRRGSGFVINNQKDQKDYLVTCRHNVDPFDGITLKQILSESGNVLEHSDLILSTKFDVAVTALLNPVDGPPFYLSDEVEMFDDVYTLGFPNVPGALPVLLGHRGEVNARAELYIQKCPALLISNLVSPGSSGCPVLSPAGRCVGMTIRWLEGEWNQEKMRFSAALPSSVIQEVLDTQLLRPKQGEH